MTKHFIFTMLSFVLFSVAAKAEAVASDLQAVFTADKSAEELVGNAIATADHVEIVSDGVWHPEYEALFLKEGMPLTVKAEEFGNIFDVKFQAAVDDLTTDNTCKILSAKGPEINSLEALEGKYNITVNSTDTIISWSVRFDDGVRLSDITFSFAADTYLTDITVYLDATPQLPEGPINLTGDDKLEIAKRSNAVGYIYDISDDTENIKNSLNDYDDYEEDFQALPDDGISLSGRQAGKYALYVTADPMSENSVTQDLKHVIINYTEKSTSTAINEVATSTVEYYDLMGHKLATPAKGVQILRQGTTSRVIVR